ncbi:MAG: ABC transporter permease [Bryobacterales bacterium]|nr:ABC transporter permease [Bryobacterales bacterium]
MNLYRILLRACPAAFRAEYGAEMEALFRRRLRGSSPAERLWLWLTACLDVPRAGAGAHLDLLRQDLLLAARSARKAPGFTGAVVAVAALGVAASTAVFSIADHVLFRALPFPEPQALVKLWQKTGEYARMDVSPANYRDWKSAGHGFESMAAFRALTVNLSGLGEPERLSGASVNHDLFHVLGIGAELGRTFTPEEDRAGSPGTVILSHGFWLRRFGGDPAVIGRPVQLDGEPFTIIGVMPAGFNYPRRDVQIWTAMRFTEDDFADRGNCFLGVVARLKPGVALEQAQAGMSVVAANIEKAYPSREELRGITVIPLRDEVPARSRTALVVLVAAAFFVLLIACANLANLLAFRGASRRREMQVRTALGAGRDRLVRQLLTESGFLAVLGGCLGTGLAIIVVPLLSRLAPAALPIAEVPVTDWRVLCFAVALTLLTGIAAGVAPALRVGSDALSARGGGAMRHARLRRVLVAVQIGASLALVISTGLLGRALLKLQAQEPGFATVKRLTFRTSLPMPKYLDREPRERFYKTVLEGIRALPGVRSASVISFRPMGDFRGGIWKVIVPGEARDTRGSARFVTPEYFNTMGIPLLRGRDFLSTDKPETGRVAIVSQSFVEDHWPGESGLGRRFAIPFGDLSFTIAGVVADVRFRGLEFRSEPQMYFAHSQAPDKAFVWFAPKDFVIAASVRPDSLIPAIRRIVERADPQQPVSDVQTLTELVSEETAARRTQLWVVIVFSAAALMLAGVGIHSLLAFSVAQRTQEIGVRRALGAQAGHIASLVLFEALLLSMAGAALGAGGAYWLGSAMEALLAGVSASDLGTLAASFGVLSLMAALGLAAPLIRALRVDPAATLRAE